MSFHVSKNRLACILQSFITIISTFPTYFVKCWSHVDAHARWKADGRAQWFLSVCAWRNMPLLAG